MFQKIKKILGLAIVVLALFVNAAFAETNKIDKTSHNKASSATKTIKTENVGDPDLKLSIEELKKKYPISLLDEKKKNYKPGQKINIDDYSIEEIKAAFLNADSNFVRSYPIKMRFVDTKNGGGFAVDKEVIVKNQQEVILIEKACDKLAHSDWSKLNKKWNDLFSFIFSDRLPISYYAIKYIPQEVGHCLDLVEEVRGL